MGKSLECLLFVEVKHSAEADDRHLVLVQIRQKRWVSYGWVDRPEPPQCRITEKQP